jgi:hypothetical protein
MSILDQLKSYLEDEAGNMKQGASLAQVVRDHPELASGLDEYVQHRESHMRRVSQTDQRPSIGHSLLELLRKLGK